MNPCFVNKYLLFREQDTKKAVLLLLFSLFPFAALLPHAHLSAAAVVLILFGVGMSGAHPPLFSLPREKLYAFFLALTLSGGVLPEAGQASVLAFLLRLSFFLPLLFEKFRREMCRMISLLGGVIGLLTLLSFCLRGGSTEYSDPSLFPTLRRASGLFGNPNVTAAFLLPPALLSLDALLFAREGRVFSLLTLAGSLMGIAATYARGAWLALLAASLLLASRRFGACRVLVILVSFAPLLLLLCPAPLKARLLSVLSPDTSVLYRFSLWKSIFRLPPRTLLFGVGEGKRAMLSAVKEVLAGGLLHIEHTHSVFLHLLLAEGAVGLLLFGALSLFSLFGGRDTGARAALVSLLLFGIFDDPLYSGQTEVFFWLTLGLC